MWNLKEATHAHRIFQTGTPPRRQEGEHSSPQTEVLWTGLAADERRRLLSALSRLLVEQLPTIKSTEVRDDQN